jgi:hypothetical protein
LHRIFGASARAGRVGNALTCAEPEPDFEYQIKPSVIEGSSPFLSPSHRMRHSRDAYLIHGRMEPETSSLAELHTSFEKWKR